MEIENIENGEYDVNGNFVFTTNQGELKLKAVDALEIAYTLFDWAKMPYDILDELQEKMED